MRLRRIVNYTVPVIAALLSIGAVQTPDFVGMYEYVPGKSCSVTAFNSDRYIKMTYGDNRGRIEFKTNPNGTIGFVWTMETPNAVDLKVEPSFGTTIEAVVNQLCGIMILFQDGGQTGNLDPVFQDFLDGLEAER